MIPIAIPLDLLIALTPAFILFALRVLEP